MKAKKVLFITSEMTPYVSESSLANKGRQMPQLIQELGHEIRTFSPNWGTINERRNQLHEVIRLSGMNIIIDDTDHQLIIKVASLQAARMQIYFIDNEEFFNRKGLEKDEDGKEYTDNGERAIFYARGVLETVKKLRWVPDLIHCHGWAAAMAPLLIKKAYKDEPSFADAKVVFSAGAGELKTTLGDKFLQSIPFRDITTDDVTDIFTSDATYDDLAKIAIKFSDGVILDSDQVSQDVIDYANANNKPLLGYQGDDYAQAYNDFYETIM